MVAPLNSKTAFDATGLEDLRRSAKENSPEALKAAAKQFEAVFMGMMLKSMREASQQDSMFNNEQTKMYTSMLDQQLSQTMASKGVGLADVLVRQLSGNYDTRPTDAPARVGKNSVTEPNSSLTTLNKSALSDKDNRPKHVQDFHNKVADAADAASKTTGIPAKFMIGQAALESGWGRREIKGSDGTSSNNIFGIKATSGWTGKTVTALTTEYINGVPYKKEEKFRAYDSYEDAFQDYAKILKSNSRYEQVIANAKDINGFAQGLQKAGYATDPQYAAKLTRLIHRSLNV